MLYSAFLVMTFSIFGHVYYQHWLSATSNRVDSSFQVFAVVIFVEKPHTEHQCVSRHHLVIIQTASQFFLTLTFFKMRLLIDTVGSKLVYRKATAFLIGFGACSTGGKESLIDTVNMVLKTHGLEVISHSGDTTEGFLNGSMATLLSKY